MVDNGFIITLLALVGVITFYNENKKRYTRENYLGNLPSFATVKEKVVQNSPTDFYSVSNFQSNLSPRMQNVQYPAHIRYNFPDVGKLASDPTDPLSYGDMVNTNQKKKKNDVVENYGCGSSPSYLSTPVMDSDYASGNYIEEVNKAVQASDYPDVSEMIPMSDMTTMSSVDADGQQQQQIIYDQFMYSANKNGRLYSQQDPIRGSLSIAPILSTQDPNDAVMFRPSVSVNDLNPGALAVMGGQSEQSQSIASLINEGSGSTTLSGVDMSTSTNIYTGRSMADVNVTAFP